ncbi:serine/threonine-protein kinase [Hyalangium rubrum]|uniref:Serine/threonine-protein kinase n=1 Tax=Hyalangium rubrum TaxID=3103134 RepID=A0ABU5HGU5_9BACT|nr:serine/threonine-protein kinase [Hyalangium sp. s54d21]MDY7232571.1 serine/threonine-protein kinase [Hyalangium sp. s54d21]
MSQVSYQPLGPLMSGEGSRAFLGLALEDGVAPHPVVLIWAPPEVAQDADLTDKLRRETQRAVVFEHPNILRVHGLVSLEQGLARVTEYADGESLRRVLEVTPRIPPPLAARLVADAAMGAHYAHMAGNDDGSPLVHGDLRPETLIISFQGVCKVTGYGALGVAPRERGGRRVRNRRKYSAPEQLLGGREAVNIQTDVFLLGLVLYECLTGKVPFKDAKDADTATLTEALPHLPPNIPKELDAVVQKATAKRANERYPSALAMRDALVAAMGDLPQQDVLSVFMNRLFPVKETARAARAQVISLGMEQALRRSEANWPTVVPSAQPHRPAPEAAPSAPAPKAAPVPAPKSPTRTAELPATPVRASAPAPVPAPVPAATAAVSAPVAAAPAPNVPVAPAPSAPASQRSRLPLVIGALALVSAAAAVVVWRGKLPGDYSFSSEAGDAGVSLASLTPGPAPIDPLAMPDAGEAPDAGVADGGVDAGTELELIVDPRVDILLSDGGVLGRTPLTAPMPAGRHVLSLSNPALGIQTARSVTVNLTGRTTQRFYLNKGFVTIRGPEGSIVQVDGRKVGTTPVEELDLYEGYHRLVVTVGSARWTKSFQLDATQRVTFTVDFEEPEEEP